VDGLTLVMLVTVTFVGTLIAIYSAGYMAGDPGYPRYFAVVSLFLFSMTGLVLANNLVLLYAFWEGVGVCSYLLIGFWFNKPSAARALIHAAAMVTAGVYLVARCMPLFGLAPGAQLVVACVGGGTALLGALMALTQTDLKRVLAYSTVSQLGYMFLALGCGVKSERLAMFAVAGAIFHLFTHAFFKALLFLAAGSVMHAMGDVIDMRRFGGLRKVLP